MQLSIIIVNWNSADYLRKSLQSIYRETTDLDFEIIVVDNASFDGTERLLRYEFPKVKYVQSSENIGFARANNLGFQHCSGETILFLNPDTEVLDSAISSLFSNLYALSKAGAVGGRLLNSDGSVQISCIQAFPTILNQIFDLESLQMRFPWLRIWGIRPLFFDRGVPEEVEVVSGACLLVKRVIFESVGMFSTDYFMYCEDVELCYRIRQAGWKVYYVGKAKVIHHGGSSARQHPVDSLEDVLTRESRFRFLDKTKGISYAKLYKVSLISVSIARLSVVFAVLPLARLFKKDRDLNLVAKKWRKLLRWSIGMEG